MQFAASGADVRHTRTRDIPQHRLTVATKASSVARPLKLSNVNLGYYLDGWPSGKTEHCEPVSVRRCGP